MEWWLDINLLTCVIYIGIIAATWKKCNCTNLRLGWLNWEILKGNKRDAGDGGSENVARDKYAKWGKAERAQ